MEDSPGCIRSIGEIVLTTWVGRSHFTEGAYCAVCKEREAEVMIRGKLLCEECLKGC